MIRVDASELERLMARLEDAATELDGDAASIPTAVDAGAASEAVSRLVGSVIDASIRMVGETLEVRARALEALEDLGMHESTASGTLESQMR